MKEKTKLLAALKDIEANSQDNRWYRGLVYGDTKSGKTTLAARVAKENDKLYHIASDSGWTSATEDPHNVIEASVLSVPYVGLSQIWAVGTAIQDGELETDWVLLDTFSAMVEKDQDKVANKWEGKAPGERDPDLANFASSVHDVSLYNVSRNRWRDALTPLLEAPVHIMFVCHMREPSFMNAEDSKSKPNLPNQVFQVVSRECHVVTCLIKDKRKGRELRLNDQSRYTCGSRITNLTKDVDDETFIEETRKWIANV
jgi:hypothetical protein